MTGNCFVYTAPVHVDTDQTDHFTIAVSNGTTTTDHVETVHLAA